MIPSQKIPSIDLIEIINEGTRREQRARETELALRLVFVRIDFLESGHCPGGIGRGVADFCHDCLGRWVEYGGRAR